MNRETGELVTVESETGVQALNLGMLQGGTPQAMLNEAAAIATPLKAFIKERGLFRHFGGDKPHVEATGWSTMLIMLGVSAQEISVVEVPVDVEGFGSKYVAKMALVRISDQQVICSASAECGGVDERDWHFKNKYRWENGPNGQRNRILDGVAPVPGNVRRSMAITRATGKAARVGFSWIMELAGYSPTPAEEMEDSGEKETPEHKHNPNTGKDPRDLMDKNAKPEQKVDTGVQQLTAQAEATCKICSGVIKVGTEIAFSRTNGGGSIVAHWDCYLDTQNAQEGK